MNEFEKYATVSEVATRLKRTEAEIWRMLECGELPAILRAKLSDANGNILGFDYALLPPEGVARVLHQGGDSFRLQWTFAKGQGNAVCDPARPEGIRILWEPDLFTELIESPGETAAPAQAVKATPVERANNAPAWTVTKPQRNKAYSLPLYRFLTAAQLEGKQLPTARDVVEAWRTDMPAEIAKVLPEGFDYYGADGDTKTADLNALGKAIRRMTRAR